MICQSFALRAILNGHPCSTYGAGPGSGLAFVLLRPDARVDPTQPAGSREREGDLPQQGKGGGGAGGMSG